MLAKAITWLTEAGFKYISGKKGLVSCICDSHVMAKLILLHILLFRRKILA